MNARITVGEAADFLAERIARHLRDHMNAKARYLLDDLGASCHAHFGALPGDWDQIVRCHLNQGANMDGIGTGQGGQVGEGTDGCGPALDSRILETVSPRVALIERANAARKAVKHLAAEVSLAKVILLNDISGLIGKYTSAQLRDPVVRAELSAVFPHDDAEACANLMLAYRHLEDASMRLGKAIQAADGGVSVYDKATTVGAPE